ncbi:MAG: hypothetical protein KDA96_01085 [Planctomycetaceae bacterium]|nr:hypothetical protein [Planctomycetaceae bacterium]
MIQQKVFTDACSTDLRLFSWGRLVAMSVASVVVVCLMALPAVAQSEPPGEQQVLNAGGWPIHISYFEASGSSSTKEAPVIILLAGAEGDAKNVRTRRVWDKTALALQKAGYAVVSVDLRKHGDSKPAEATPAQMKVGRIDYQAMVVEDLEAVKAFLLQQHQAEKLNIRKTGIVAARSSAMVAAGFAVSDWAKTPFPDAPRLEDRTPKGQDVRAILMLSPESAVPGLSGGQSPLAALKQLPVAVSIFASTKSKDERASAERIYKSVQLPGEQFKEVRKVLLTNDSGSGEDFVEGNKADTTNKEIIQPFFDAQLKSLNEPWRTRESRLQ